MSTPMVVMAQTLTDDSPSYICIQDYYQHHHKTAGSSSAVNMPQVRASRRSFRARSAKKTAPPAVTRASSAGIVYFSHGIWSKFSRGFGSIYFHSKYIPDNIGGNTTAAAVVAQVRGYLGKGTPTFSSPTAM